VDSIREQLIHELDKLSPEQQEHLLDVARRLQTTALPSGTPGNVLLEHMDRFEFAPGAVDEMMRVIEEGCERVDWDGWQ
jgi:hypothetical protein